jgi:hypothetical protein
MTDRQTVRMVVVILGLVALGALGIMGALALRSQSTPDPLIALSSSAVGAVASLLVRTSSEDPAR